MSWDNNSQQSAPASGGNAPGPLLDTVLAFIKEQKASDLHLSGGKFFARVHGELKPLQGLPHLTPEQVAEALSHVTTQEHWQHFLDNKELDCAYTTPDGHRFRVNLFVQRGTSVVSSVRSQPRLSH